MKHYDYIIIGAGCAGLSLLMRLIDTPDFHLKKVLLVDKELKSSNDRTWCFWESKNGYFDHLVHKTWRTLIFKNNAQQKQLDVGNYSYKMIRSVDFYAYCLNHARQRANIEILLAKVEKVEHTGGQVCISTAQEQIPCSASYVFSSLRPQMEPRKKTVSLVQHFKGWVIESANIAFDPHRAILMDFDIDQGNHPAAFFYVLPLSPTRALVEYTIFSENTIPAEAYDDQLKKYINSSLRVHDYTIEHIEYGEIPMTSQPFPLLKNSIYYIGTAGGQTKASTGYTFSFIQKQTADISRRLAAHREPLQSNPIFYRRFSFYDAILLRVLAEKKLAGKEIFSTLFDKIPAHEIFSFLDNETGLLAEWRLMRSMPNSVFLPVALTECFG